jgi:anti-sigma regulatory factor (Ser/Thr protein kinase)
VASSPEQQAAEHRLEIRGDLADLSGMSAWLGSVVEGFAVPATTVFAFDLCANEAVTNTISYGYRDDPADHRITLQVQREGDFLSLTITDDGIAFNPLERGSRALPADIESAPIGGLGVELIQKYMDRVRYARVGDRNILTMLAALG